MITTAFIFDLLVLLFDMQSLILLLSCILFVKNMTCYMNERWKAKLVFEREMLNLVHVRKFTVPR